MMKADLFSKAQEQRCKPLAAEIRPETLDELIGQQHILGPNGPLRRRVRAGRLGTVILFGPPYLDSLKLPHKSQMGGNSNVE